MLENESKYRLACLIPVAPRLERLRKFLENYNLIVNHEKQDLYFVVDKKDSSLIDEFKDVTFLNIIQSPFNSHLHSLNYGIKLLSTKYDFITYLNDDMYPESEFVNKLEVKLNLYSNQISDQVFAIFFKDGIQNGIIATCFTISKNYSILFGGKVYSDEYFHGYYADLEFNKVGHLLKRLFYCDDILVKHDYYELRDNVNVSNENAFMVNDEKIFKLRKKNKFNLDVYKYRLSKIDQIKFL